jgi:hypothetical protein
MANVIVDLTSSLDGFIAAASDSPELPLGRGGMRLFDWYWMQLVRRRRSPSAVSPGRRASNLNAAEVVAVVRKLAQRILMSRALAMGRLSQWRGQEPQPAERHHPGSWLMTSSGPLSHAVGGFVAVTRSAPRKGAYQKRQPSDCCTTSCMPS